MTSTTTVVLIEDNAVFLGLLTAFLERSEPTRVQIVGSARSGEDGLAIAAAARPKAAIVDIKLPGISGLEVITRLRADDPGLAIVAMSSAEADAFRDPAAVAGADAFVPKDRMNTDLLPALHGAVRARADSVTSGDHVDG
jgi:DNA-binding NarL/FixJ family response regulator